MRSFTASASRETSCPSTQACPAEGSSRPQSNRRVVVFPAPSGPTNPNTSPRVTARFSRSTAVTAPKRRVRSRASTTDNACVLIFDPLRTRQGASPLDIPQAGYGSQESGARSQNRSGVAAQQPARFLQRTRQRLGVAVAKILAQNQVVTTLFY